MGKKQLFKQQTSIPHLDSFVKCFRWFFNVVYAFKGFKFSQPFKLYPNPVQNNQLLNIEISSHINVQNLTIQIVDITGKLRLEKSFQQQNKIQLETGNLTRGIYFIKLKTNDHFWSEQLLVFKRIDFKN